MDAESAELGDIVAVSGMADLNIGETACDPEHVEPLPFVKIDEPTVSMMFMVNNSPFAGREGKYVTSRNLRDRLFKEVETNVAMRVEETVPPIRLRYPAAASCTSPFLSSRCAARTTNSRSPARALFSRKKTARSWSRWNF